MTEGERMNVNRGQCV